MILNLRNSNINLSKNWRNVVLELTNAPNILLHTVPRTSRLWDLLTAQLFDLSPTRPLNFILSSEACVFLDYHHRIKTHTTCSRLPPSLIILLIYLFLLVVFNNVISNQTLIIYPAWSLEIKISIWKFERLLAGTYYYSRVMIIFSECWLPVGNP